MRRRELLGTAAAGAVGVLAGCTRCGETWYGHRLSFSLDAVAPTAEGYELTVSATVAFEFPKDERDGVGTFDIALYGADRSLLAVETVEGLRWGQVPEQERIEGECGPSGTATATRTVTVPDRPHYVGPRFHDGREAAALEPNSTAGFHELTTLRYREAGGAPDGDGTATTGDGTTSEATTTDATTTEPTSDDLSPADYELVSVEQLPWPTPDLQAVDATESLTNVRFSPIRGCYERGEPTLVFSLYRADLRLRWSRPVPESECQWPFLEALSFSDGRLTVDVGLGTAPAARCDPCDARRYELLLDYREDREVTVEEVLVRHLGPDGSVRERRVVTTDRGDEPQYGDDATTSDGGSSESTSSATTTAGGTGDPSPG